MLAQNFQTAAALGITAPELDALIKVLGMLEREEATFARRTDLHSIALTSPVSFHMAITAQRNDCGTIACIGGWAAYFMKADPNDYVFHRRSPRLSQLYWPPSELVDSITPVIAAVALRTYLVTGEVNWADSMSVG